MAPLKKKNTFINCGVSKSGIEITMPIPCPSRAGLNLTQVPLVAAVFNREKPSDGSPGMPESCKHLGPSAPRGHGKNSKFCVMLVLAIQFSCSISENHVS